MRASFGLFLILTVIQLSLTVVNWYFTFENYQDLLHPDTSFDYESLERVYLVSVRALWISWGLSVVAFLHAVWRAKRFLSAKGGLRLDPYWMTVGSLAIPIANFVIPWSRFGVIKKTLRGYLRTNRFAIEREGNSGVVPLGALYFSCAFAERVASFQHADTVLEYERYLRFQFVADALFVLSACYAIYWLGGLCADLSGAVQKYEVSPPPPEEE